MADTQDIIVRYQSEVDEAVKNIDKLAQAQDKITEAEKDQEKQAKETANAESIATKKRLENLKAEQAELKRLTNEKKKAFTVKDISAFNAKINESQKRISVLKNEISGSSGVLNQFGSQAKNVFAGIAAGALAAFSTQAIINFADQSVKAFLDAEKNAQKLRFAITTINGESEASFERLIKQSEKLQKITVFSDDSIQQAQSALAAFGLTANEIERLIPLLADYATASGNDLAQSVEQVGAALEGNGRELKKYQIEVSATASRTENLNEVTQGFIQFEGAAAAAAKTLSGELQKQANEVDDLQEKIGKGLAPAWVAVKKATFEATLAIIDYFKFNGNVALGQLSKKIQESGTAIDEVTERVQEGTKKLIAEGKSADEARKESIQIVRQEILERLKLRIEQAQAAKDNEKSTDAQLSLARLRLGGVRNEVRAIEDLIAVDRERAQQTEQELTNGQLKNKSIEQLNNLLKLNQQLNTVISRRNIDAIEKELQARKEAESKQKQNQDIRIAGSAKEVEQLKSIAAEYKDILKLQNLSEADRQVLELTIEAGDIEGFRKKVAEIVANNPIEVPVQLTVPDNRAETEMVDAAKSVEMTWLEANQQIFQSSLELFGELTNLFNTFADARIDRINAEKQASIESIDAQILANEEALKNRQITNRTEEQLNKKLQEDKVAAEKKADKEIRKIQRQQAILDKANALFQIALNTAIALADAKNLATFGALSPLIIALGAAQAAAVAAAPIPGFAKGTKGKKDSGMAMVGEIGAEAVYLPQGSKVVPNRQTKKYAGFVDAMIDDNLERYIQKHYVAPQLMAQKRAYEQGSFSQTPTKARLYNPETKPLKFPSGMNIENYDELASAIASKLQNTRRRS